MSTYYVRDLTDAINAIESLFEDKLESELSSKDDEIERLMADIEDLQSEVEELKEFKTMYEELCK